VIPLFILLTKLGGEPFIVGCILFLAVLLIGSFIQERKK